MNFTTITSSRQSIGAHGDALCSSVLSPPTPPMPSLDFGFVGWPVHVVPRGQETSRLRRKRRQPHSLNDLVDLLAGQPLARRGLGHRRERMRLNLVGLSETGSRNNRRLSLAIHADDERLPASIRIALEGAIGCAMIEVLEIDRVLAIRTSVFFCIAF